MSEERIKVLEDNQQKLIGHIKEMHDMIASLIQTVNENFEEVKDKIDKLDGSTEQGFKDVKWELKKIQDVTKYADEYLNIPSAGQA